MEDLREALLFVCSLEFWRMAVFWTLSLLASYLRLYTEFLFSRKYKSYPRCHPPHTGYGRPLCVITGATSGLGAAAAHELSREGFCVVLVGRSSHLLSKVMAEIKAKDQNAHLKAFQVDISSLQSILDFKASFHQWLLNSEMHSSIQLLINNAGILATSSRLTPEGSDMMMATNYIGAFRMTKFLLPFLKRSPVPSRIVNVTSFTHRCVFDVQVNKETVSGIHFLRSKAYPYAHIYEYSKLCLILFSYELHQQLALIDNAHHVSVLAADPGVVETNIMREVPACLSHLAYFGLKFLGLLQSPERGSTSIIDAALSPPEVSGVYFFGGKGRTIDSSALSHRTKVAKELWTTSCDLSLEPQISSDETLS